MELTELTEKLNFCLDNGDKAGFIKEVDIILKKISEEQATEILAAFLFSRYNSFRADSIAGQMEIILRKNINLGLINYPDNNLFRVAVLHGSMDLFNCYIEEFVQPYLKKNKNIETDSFYTDLIEVVEFYIEKIEEQEQPIIKGMHFNGAFSKSKENPDIVLINNEDYEIMDSVVEKYNALLGRKAILKSLWQFLEEL